MHERLKSESEKLRRAWDRHDATMLRDYLVAGVEDPRINLQSVLTRHFLVGALCGERFRELMDQEIRFAAAMNWLQELRHCVSDASEVGGILRALQRKADDMEGLAIPRFASRIFATLPTAANGFPVPNYVEAFLSETQFADGKPIGPDGLLHCFQDFWQRALAELPRQEPPLSLLEAACGAANDYRFFHAFGLARLLDYTGFDLCEKNVANARGLFPSTRFESGNVFEIAAPDKSRDLLVAHDLFEHLSLEGLAVAVKEVCRVTRRALCLGFFSMDERPDHVVRPVDDYHWNTLSLDRVKALFTQHGFAAQTIHIGTFLKRTIGCDHTHNPNAYTLIMRPW
jgi:hypothetical protein